MIICATAQQIKYIMNKIVFFVLSFVLISCETPINSLEKKKMSYQELPKLVNVPNTFFI